MTEMARLMTLALAERGVTDGDGTRNLLCRVVASARALLDELDSLEYVDAVPARLNLSMVIVRDYNTETLQPGDGYPIPFKEWMEKFDELYEEAE